MWHQFMASKIFHSALIRFILLIVSYWNDNLVDDYTINVVNFLLDHSHDNSVGLCVLMGILAFLIVEKFVRMVKGKLSRLSFW